MPYFFENSAVQLEIHPSIARWSASSRYPNSPSLGNIQLNLAYRQGRRREQILDRWPDYSLSESEIIIGSHGPGKIIQLHTRSSRARIKTSISFALPTQHPVLLWKLTIENQGLKPVYIDKIELFSTGYIHRTRQGPHGQISFPRSVKPKAKSLSKGSRDFNPLGLSFYSNGWQSWSRSGSYRSAEQYLQTHLGFIRAPLVKNAQTPNPHRSGMFASDMFGVLGERHSRRGFLLGFLSQKNHFGSLETWLGGPAPSLKMWANGDGARLDAGKVIETDWACLQFLHLDHPDPLAPYLEAVMREHDIAPGRFDNLESPSGWCSWYQFSGEDYVGQLSAGDIRENLHALGELCDQLPLQVIQIDDGFEAQIGDWNTFNDGFPNGVAPLSIEIQAENFTPGLWLAPFIVHPKSKLSEQHPEWILKNRLGRPINAGFLWNSFTQALDLTLPDARQYVREVVHSASQVWNFPYLKLDFLYAAALPGIYSDPTQTRAQVMRSSLELIRSAAGDKTFLLGCGCPLGPAIGLVDGMRIGSDTARRWNPFFKGIQFLLKKEASFPSAFNAVHNTLTRSDLHNRWWINDPDCLLLRPETQLTRIEVETIASVIALSGGSLMISDHVPALPEERLAILKVLLPLIGKRPYILDLFDSSTPERMQLDLDGPAGPWHLVAVFNWKDAPKDITIDFSDLYLEESKALFARDFWAGRTYLVEPDNEGNRRLSLNQVPAHGVILLAVRPRNPFHPQYLGGNLHISQGLEVASWQMHEHSLKFVLERPGYTQGEIEISLPGKINHVVSNDAEITWKELAPGTCLFNLEFDQSAEIEIQYL
jgi:alpha-galactosidase